MSPPPPPIDPTPDPELLVQLKSALDPSYDIEREIGSGMSRVFVATERALGRKVVIKVLPPELTAGVNRDRFRREIQFAARLQHPHIVPLLTAGQVGDILYYTMPLVEGETLRARLERQGRMSPAEVVSILQDVVDALAYAHTQGLVHRDIKPENILLQRHHALVTDFGVAKAIREALPGTAATTIGIAVGTPAYMAPEQLAADPAADHRVDLYAAGLLGYELLSGSSPFSGSSPQRTLARQMTERPTPPHLGRSDVPPGLSALIMRCLEKDPAARFQTADELLQALAAVRVTSSGMRGLRRTITLAAMPPARRRLVLGSMLVLLLATGIALYSMLGAHRTAAPRGPDSGTVADSANRRESGAVAVLTRADSEAIAAAFARRILEQRGPGPAPAPPAPPPPPPPPSPVPPPAVPPTSQPTLVTPPVITLPGIPIAPGVQYTRGQFDSIRIQVERMVADSILRALARHRTAIRPPLQKDLEKGPEFAPKPGEPGSSPGRLVVLQIVDVSPGRTLGDLATALTDSLVQSLRKKAETGATGGGKIQILSGKRVDDLERELQSDQLLGMSLGATTVLRGSLAARRDSLLLFVAMYDTRDQRYLRSFRALAPRTDPGALVSRIVGQMGTGMSRPVRRGPE
ncbi:MAG: serine/threonine-protein kinase [Gemmatimonadales bacterium]